MEGEMRVRANIMDFKGLIAIVTPQLAGVRGNDKVAQTVRAVSENLQRNQVGNIVVVPASCLDRLKNAKDRGAYFDGTSDGIHVIALKSKWNELYPSHENGIEQILSFGNNFWGLLQNKKLGEVGLVNGHDWPMGLLFWEQSGFTGDIATIFSLYDPLSWDWILPRTAHDKELWPAFEDRLAGPFHKEGVSCFKAGVLSADYVTLWTYEQMEALKEFGGTNDYSGFMKHLMGPSGNKRKFIVIGRLGDSWTPASDEALPQNNKLRIDQIYRQALFGTGYEFSRNLMAYPKEEVAALYMSITEKNPEDKRAQILLERMKKAHPDLHEIKVFPRYVVNYPSGQEVISSGYRGNMGGLLQVIKEGIMANGGSGKKNQLSLIFLNGGDGERGFVCTLNSCAKGELVMGNRTIGAISQDTAAVIGRQLPINNGWAVIYGCDNYLIPNGEIIIGDHHLSEAKQGIILFGQPQKVRGATDAELDGLKSLGVFVVDPVSGDILSFGEKKQREGKFDRKWAEDLLDKHGGDNCYKNTFFFAIRSDVLAALQEGYERPSVLNHKPMHEAYDLDISNHFTSALFLTRPEWEERFSNSKHPSSKGFAFDDWMFLWDNAHRVLEIAGGAVGGASIGEGKETWSDIGTIEEHYFKFKNIFAQDDNIRMISREMMGIPNDRNIVRSVTKGVTLPKGGNYFLSRAIFKKGGSVGNNVIVIDSIFEEAVDIPDNSIIIGSRIYKIDMSGSKAEQFIYFLHQDSSDARLVIRDNCAYSSIYLLNHQKVTGVFPIFLKGKEVSPTKEKDEYLGEYTKDGKMVQQPIVGIKTISDPMLLERLKAVTNSDDIAELSTPSVKNLKRVNSLRYSDDARKNLETDIEVLLLSMGIT